MLPIPEDIEKGWKDDPWQRYDYRLWDGTKWSNRCSQDGKVVVDNEPLSEIDEVDIEDSEDFEEIEDSMFNEEDEIDEDTISVGRVQDEDTISVERVQDEDTISVAKVQDEDTISVGRVQDEDTTVEAPQDLNFALNVLSSEFLRNLNFVSIGSNDNNGVVYYSQNEINDAINKIINAVDIISPILEDFQSGRLVSNSEVDALKRDLEIEREQAALERVQNAAEIERIKAEKVVEIEKIIEVERPFSGQFEDNEVVKDDANSLGRILVKAQNVADETIDEARAQAKDLVETATSTAKELVDTATGKASRLVAEAQLNADNTVAAAEEQANMLVTDATNTANSLVATATSKANKLVEDATAESTRLTDEAISVLENAKQESRSLLDTAETDALVTMENAKQYEDNAKAEISKLVSKAQESLGTQETAVKTEIQEIIETANKERQEIYNSLLKATNEVKDAFGANVEIPQEYKDRLKLVALRPVRPGVNQTSNNGNATVTEIKEKESL